MRVWLLLLSVHNPEISLPSIFPLSSIIRMQHFPKDMYLYFAMLYYIHVYPICYMLPMCGLRFWEIKFFSVLVIKDTCFCPELTFKTISKPLGNFTENAIFRIFIKIWFKSFDAFLIKCVMQVTCKLRFTEKGYSRKFDAPKFVFAFFSKNIPHDLAATSNTAKIFLLRKQMNSVILNLRQWLSTRRSCR